jgi:DNA primase
MTRVSDSEIAAARAVPIAAVVGAVTQLSRDFALCCFHQERSPSLHVDRKRNLFCCFGCGAKGDGIEFVRRAQGVDFAEAVRQLSGGDKCSSWNTRGIRPHVVEKAPRETETPSLVSDLWRTADAPKLAELYLWSRGLRVRPRALPAALRGHRAVLWAEEAGDEKPAVAPPWRAWWSPRTRTWWHGVEQPAVLAAVSDERGTVTALQRVWVRDTVVFDGSGWPSKGAQEAGLTAPKKTLGSMGTGAVRLADAGETLGLAEGFESALSAAELWRLPVWATLGAHRLGAVALPDVVHRVVIFADSGDAGEAAAAKACTAYRRRGYAAEAVFPELGRLDWNDQLRAELA